MAGLWLGWVSSRTDTRKKDIDELVMTDTERATGWVVSFTKRYARIVVQRDEQ